MQGLTDLLVDVWREAGHHLAIEESVERIAPVLARRLPLDGMLVRRIDAARGCVETVASASCLPGPVPESSRSDLEARELELLVEWAREGRAVRRNASGIAEELPGLLPDDLDGEVVVAPLAGEEGPIGALVLFTRRPRHFDASHVAVVQALIDPLAAALENDGRVRALAAQQAAAEADRLALLSRLGRQDLSETIIGAEAGFRPVMERVGLVAPSDVPVLILGETGSGKEVVARSIHQRSRRAAGPFHRVNCGAIPSGLVDSELFGHERGSFTGAAAQRKGWFERADGGTLFLDEVGELALPAQVRLLRVLQDGSFERVGGGRTLHVDVRVVAATHRDLQAMVADGRFREDLWYRIAVFPIQLPPLRERPEDIPALATHFALRAATRFGTPPRIPSPEDMELLVAYPWPGNVRELSAVIERAVILGDGKGLDVATALGAHGPARPRRGVDAAPSAVVDDEEAKTPMLAWGETQVGGEGAANAAAVGPAPRTAQHAAFPTLDEAIRRHVEAALERTRGRIEGPRGAAALLQINPHTLRARMRKLGIAWSRFRRED